METPGHRDRRAGGQVWSSVQAGAGTHSSAAPREWILVSALACFASLVYTLPGLLAHWHFRSNYDLAIFDQAIWHLSRFEAPASTVRGFSNLLGDHFSPILAVLAPLYWVAPAPETLIVAQAVLFAASVFPVWTFLRRRLTGGQALALSLAYVLFWGLQRAAAFDFHEVAFVPLLVALVILGADTGRFGLMWGAAAALALTKEDLTPFLACVGVLLVLRGERRHGAALAIASLAAFAVVIGLVAPAFNEGGYMYDGVYGASLSRPWSWPVTLVTPPVKALTALMWLAPFAFLPLCSPLVLLAAPFAIARFLSASPQHWGTAFHYSAPLAPILAMAAGDGLARIARALGSRARMGNRLPDVLLTAAVLLSLVLPGHQPAFRLFRQGQFEETAFLASGRRALTMVPRDASVVAQTAVAPHLTHRRDAFRLDAGDRNAEFLIAAFGLSPWPLPDEAALREIVDRRRRSGYRAVFEENGWVVLHRAGPAPGELRSWEER